MTSAELPATSKLETATIGGGCFWCLEPLFKDLLGVESVVVGYAGGSIEDPSYQAVCSGLTGHAEVIQVQYDPQIIHFGDLLRIFFAIHDPTTLNRQGADQGTQYRSIILTHSADQAQESSRIIAEIEHAGLWEAPIVTEITTLDRFYPAEDYHQNYYARNPGQGYCRAVIAPKVANFRQQFARRLKSAG